MQLYFLIIVKIASVGVVLATMGDEDDLSSEDDMDKELKEWEKRQKIRKDRALVVNEIADSEESYLESLRLDSL